MKLLRSKVVAMVVTLAMVFSLLAVPVANAAQGDATTTEAAEFLKEKGLLQGNESGDLMLGQTLLRQDAVVALSRMMGEELEASTYPADELTFTDVTDEYYMPYIAWSQANGYVEGYSDEVFGFNDLVTAWQVKALLVRALGFVDTLDEDMEDMADELGITEGLDAISNAPCVRADLALLMYNALYAETVEGDVLGEVLGVVEPEVAPVLSDVVVSAENTNANSVTVTGKVAPATAVVTVAGAEVTVAEDGTFSADASLVLGENRIAVVAKVGRATDTKEVVVTKVEGLAISAEVVTDSSVKVTFNSPVADTSKIAFELKGTAVIQTTVAWNEAKTEATLTAPSMLLEGAYTVKASGDTFVEGKDSVNLIVVKNGIAKIEILSENLVQVTTTTGDFNFKLFDRYGVDITEKYANDIQIVSSVGNNGTVTDAKKGIATITKSGTWVENPATPETVAVTVIGKTTAVSANKVLTVSEKSKVSEVVLKDMVFPTTTPATTKLLSGKSTAAYIPVEAVDQYGNVVNTLSRVENSGSSEVYYIVSDSAVTVRAEIYTDKADNTDKVRLVVDTFKLKTAKAVTVSAISKATGKSTSITLNIEQPAKADRLSILSQEKLVAQGDAEGTFVLPIVVTDQYGVQLTPDEIVSNAGDFSFGGDFENTSVNDPLKTQVKIETTGVNKGKIVNDEPMVGNGTKVLTVTIAGASAGVGTYTVDIKDAAYPATIKLAKEPAANLLDNASTEMYYKLIDQYGRDMELSALTAYDGQDTYQVKLTLTGAEYVTVTSATFGSLVDVAKVASKATPIVIQGKNVEGTARIKAELYNENNTVVTSAVDTSISVVQGVPGTLTLEIAEIPVLAYESSTGVAVGVDGKDPQARPVKIIAKDASGNTYALPSDRILSVSSSNINIVKVTDLTKINADVDAQDNSWIVSGVTTEFTTNDAVGTTKTATIKAIVSTDAGVKEVSREVTVKKDLPKVVEVKFFDKALATGEYYAMPSDAKEVPSIVGTVASINDTVFYIVTKDQYGVYTGIKADKDLVVVNKDRCTADKFVWDGDGTKKITVTASQLKKDSDVFLMYTDLNSNAYGTIMIKATDSFVEIVAPTAVLPAITGDNNKATALVVTFNEDLYIGGVAVANDQDVAASFTAAGGTLAITSAKYNATNKTITFVLANAADTNTITHTTADETALTDAAGNKYAAEVYTYADTGTLWSK